MRIGFHGVAKKDSRQQPAEQIFLGLHVNTVFMAAGRSLARIHPWLIVTLGMVFLALEINEHIVSGRQNLPHFISEVVLVGLLLSFGFFLIRVLLDALSKRDQAIETLRWKYDLGIILSSSQDKDAVTRRLLQQVRLISPEAQVDLYLHDAMKNTYQLNNGDQVESAAQLPHNSSRPTRLDDSPCRLCIAQHNGALHNLQYCRQAAVARQSTNQNGFCLPLIQGVSEVGVLHLHLPGQLRLPPRQIELLTNTSFEMANALALAVQKKVVEEEALAQKVRAIQLDIARDLHDTIGQNIGYLRLRLDQLVEMEEHASPGTRCEIQHMLDVANESYDLLRGTMAVLQSGGTEDMLVLFKRFAAKVGDRSGININFQRQTVIQPQNLPPGFIRQVFFIYREVLSNIEKHAQATQVNIAVDWQDDLFMLEVNDNGSGFDPQSIPNGHYGIRFIQQRVEILRGSVTIYSSIGKGSTIRIQAPC